MPEYLYPGVYVEEKSSGSKPIEGVGTSTAAFIGKAEKRPGAPAGEGEEGGSAGGDSAKLITNFIQYADTFGSPEDKQKLLGFAVRQFFQEGGSKCYVIAVSGEDYIGKEEDRTGIYALDPIDDVNFVAIPDAKGNKDTTKAAISYCHKRKDCFFIADAPAGQNPQQIKEHVQTTFSTSSYGGIYYPWIKIKLNKTDPLFSLPPSAAVAGIYARTDTNRGVHKAPAGIQTNIRTASELEYDLTDAEHGTLNPIGVNAIRAKRNLGIAIWGARTLSTASDAEWKYINVRRLFIFLEQSLYRALQWVVFEPNTPKLWGSVKRNINAFLTKVWMDGALFGNVPEEAFFVKIDEENNPENVRDLGQLIIDIGVAPAKPAEFVILRLQQKIGGE